MAFVPKVWKNEPDHTTPLSADALIDLEERVTDYTDQEVFNLLGTISGSPSSPVDGQVIRYRRNPGETADLLIWDDALDSGNGAWSVYSAPKIVSSVTGTTVYNRNTGQGVWQAITGGPSVIIPIKGIYDVRWQLVAQLNTSGSRLDERWSLTNNGTAMYSVGAAASFHAQFAFQCIQGKRVGVAFNAADNLTIRHASQTATATSWNFFEMMIEVTPIEYRN